MRLLPLVVALLFMAGCGGGDEETAPPATTATVAAADGGCTPATTDLMTPLSNKLTIENGRLVNGQIVESTEQDDVYFVAAEIDSPKLHTSGDVGVWVTTSPHGGEAIFSVNELAKGSSDWRTAEKGEISADDPAAAAARACVF